MLRLGLGLHPPLSPLGPRWKEERRLFHAHIGKEAVQSLYRPNIELLAQKYVLRALESDINVSTDYSK